MWAVWIIFAVGSVVGYFSIANEVRQPAVANARSDDLAENMSIYRDAVVRYVTNDSAYSGTVPDASLSFPTWYVRLPWWSNVVSGGTVTVYAGAGVPSRFTTEIVRLSQNSMFAGEANRATGTLYSPVFGDTGIPVPSTVPDRATVWIAKIN